MKENLEDSKIYEIGFHILPTVQEENLQGVVSDLENSITKNDGQILSEDFPKMRNLAYEISKRVETKYLNFNKAYFGWIKFSALPEVIEKIQKYFEGNENVLRFLIIKTVRENTMNVFKSQSQPKESESVSETEEKEKTEVSEEEIDKSIDDLII